MPITLAEEIHTLSSAAKLLPTRRGGRPVHASCMFRWAKAGLRGVKLETLRVGGTLCTSKQALERFFAQLAQLDSSHASQAEIPDPRQREIAEASRKAEATLR